MLFHSTHITCNLPIAVLGHYSITQITQIKDPNQEGELIANKMGNLLMIIRKLK